MQIKIEIINIKITAPPAAIPAIAPTGSPAALEEVEASGEAEGEMVAAVSEGVPGMMAPPVVDFFGGAAVAVVVVGFGFGLGTGVVVVGFGSIMCECV